MPRACRQDGVVTDLGTCWLNDLVATIVHPSPWLGSTTFADRRPRWHVSSEAAPNRRKPGGSSNGGLACDATARFCQRGRIIGCAKHVGNISPLPPRRRRSIPLAPYSMRPVRRGPGFRGRRSVSGRRIDHHRGSIRPAGPEELWHRCDPEPGLPPDLRVHPGAGVGLSGRQSVRGHPVLRPRSAHSVWQSGEMTAEEVRS